MKGEKKKKLLQDVKVEFPTKEVDGLYLRVSLLGGTLGSKKVPFTVSANGDGKCLLFEFGKDKTFRMFEVDLMPALNQLAAIAGVPS